MTTWPGTTNGSRYRATGSGSEPNASRSYHWARNPSRRLLNGERKETPPFFLLTRVSRRRTPRKIRSFSRFDRSRCPLVRSEACLPRRVLRYFDGFRRILRLKKKVFIWRPAQWNYAERDSMEFSLKNDVDELFWMRWRVTLNYRKYCVWSGVDLLLISCLYGRTPPAETYTRRKNLSGATFITVVFDLNILLSRGHTFVL